MPKKTSGMIFADQTRKIRKAKGWTQAGLALKSNVNIETVKRIEKASANTKLSSLDAVAKGLGREPWEMITE